MYGWVFSQTIEKIRSQEDAWIKRSSFDNQLHRIIEVHRKQAFVERAKRLILLKQEDIEAERGRTFVSQVQLIASEDLDYCQNAISDFLRSTIERTRLIKEGLLTQEDFETFDDRLQERWDGIFKAHIAKETINEKNEVGIGFAIIN